MFLVQDHPNNESDNDCCNLELAFHGADDRSRTDDLGITRALLYQLSYISVLLAFHLTKESNLV